MKIPTELIETHQFIPISLKDNVLTCAFGELPPPETITAIESLTAYKIKTVLSSRSQIQSYIKQFLPEPESELVLEPTPEPESYNTSPVLKHTPKRLRKIVALGKIERASTLRIHPNYAKHIPPLVRIELAKLPAHIQIAFATEFMRKKRNLIPAYLLWFFIGCHYAYFGKWGTQIIFWLCGGTSIIGAILYLFTAFFAIFLGGSFSLMYLIFIPIGLTWWFIDFFRMPSIARKTDQDIAVEIMKNIKILTR